MDLQEDQDDQISDQPLEQEITEDEKLETDPEPSNDYGVSPKGDWDDSGFDPSEHPIPRFDEGWGSAWNKELDAIEENTRRINKEYGSLEAYHQHIRKQMGWDS
ncbi:hypothetical protein [Candidatus Chlorohelix sp.]|uniref:hypothetical protein n=1 Tax=Candidatus Chlorohelix sp. TaxID=3139201 RepID=UPI003072F67B